METQELKDLTLSELNVLTITELASLKGKINKVIDFKGNENAVALKEGDTVMYMGQSGKIKDEKFAILKINTVNARCKSYSTGVTWNIRLANIEKCEKPNVELPSKIL